MHKVNPKNFLKSDDAKNILKSYLAFTKKNKRYPSSTDMFNSGFNKDSIRYHFGSLTKLKETALIHSPKIKGSIISNIIRESDSSDELQKQVKNFKRFIITSAVSGAPAHVDFLASLHNYCKSNKALLLLMPTDHVMKDADPKLSGENWVFGKLNLNSNLCLSNIKVPAKNSNPLTSLARLGQRNGSTIIASPKQSLEFIATGNSSLPHAIMSTGAVTKPNYFDKNGNQDRSSSIAESDHVFGAVVVEIENDEIYHFRQVQFIDKGFVDLGFQYTSKKIIKMNPTHFVIGDYHVTETNPVVAKAWDEVTSALGNPVRIHHDFFSGVSINHHEEQDILRKAQLSKGDKLSLEKELRECAKILNQETEKAKTVVIVDSNHHDFLSKHFLAKMKFAMDPLNVEFASRLVGAMVNGESPLQYALEKIIGLKHPERIKWLKMDESYTVSGIELGTHGHKGANGSRGSANTLERAHLNCVVGHSHTPKILRGFWQVGTSTHLRLNYTQGASSWFNTSCLVYENGSRQMINCINGKWRLK